MEQAFGMCLLLELGTPQWPLPSKERPGTHCLCMCKIFCQIFHKRLHALPYPYVEDCTNQEYRAFFELDSSDELTCRALLGYYFSDVAVSFFQTYCPTCRTVTNRFIKQGRWQPQIYLSPFVHSLQQLCLEHDQPKRCTIQCQQAANRPELQSLASLFA